MPAGEQPLRRGAPLPLQDSLRAGLLLAELLFNVPVDYMRAHQVPCLESMCGLYRLLTLPDARA